MRRELIPGALISCVASVAAADYTIWLESGGRDWAQVSPGETLALEVWLSSDTGDVHDASIWRVEFSGAGLMYEAYEWATPYETGSIFDESKPFLDDLPLTLNEHTLEGGAYEDGVVDVELANLTMQGTFEQGWLASLRLRVPDDYTGDDLITVSLAPDSFALGFDEVATRAIGSFEIRVPTPGPVLLLAVGGVVGVRRQRARG